MMLMKCILYLQHLVADFLFGTGDDLESLLFHFLDEFLFLFSADPFFIPKVRPN